MPNTEFQQSLTEAFAEVERQFPGSYWLLAKGKTRADEPMFGFQIMFGSEEVLATGEGDTEVAAIRDALDAAARDVAL